MLISNQSTNLKNPIRATFAGCEEFKKYFATSNCVIGISVGQEPFEGDRLKSLLNLINRNFESCTILVGDVLQRHNLYFTSTKYEDSVRNGDDWLLRNSDIISDISIPYSVDRWEKWLNSKLFLPYLKQVENEYYMNNFFFEAVTDTIQEYYRRILARENLKIDKDYFFEMSKNYLLEEIAIINLMLPQVGYNYLIYPNKIPSAFESAYEIFVKPLYPEMMKWVHVKLKKK